MFVYGSIQQGEFCIISSWFIEHINKLISYVSIRINRLLWLLDLKNKFKNKQKMLINYSIKQSLIVDESMTLKSVL